jgi:cell division protein ZapA
MKRSITVQIAGQRYTLKSDADEDEVKALAAHVDSRIREIQKAVRGADTQSVAVLAALQVTEDLFKERAVAAALKKKVRDKSQALLTFLERQARV